MSSRRGFFALVGGAAVSGLVTVRAFATRSTLIMPPTGLVLPSTPWPLLETEQTEMHGFIHVKRDMPDDAFRDWLEAWLWPFSARLRCV